MSDQKYRHGLRSTYLKGCRCKSCREAAREYVKLRNPVIPKDMFAEQNARARVQQQESQNRASRSHRRWEAWEDAIAGDYSRSIFDIACELERSIYSVRNRRQILNLREKWYSHHILPSEDSEE